MTAHVLSFLGRNTQTGYFKYSCSDVVRSENSLNSEPKDLHWKPAKARRATPTFVYIFHTFFLMKTKCSITLGFTFS